MQATIVCKCDHCGIECVKLLTEINRTRNHFCSIKCQYKFRYVAGPRFIKCEQCGKTKAKKPHKIRKDKHHFCSHSCQFKWTRRHIKYGTRVSKLEKWLQHKLLRKYKTELLFTFNSSDTIGLELDIYIPQLKLAIEIQGPTHYMPIYGMSQFMDIKRRDRRRYVLCRKMGIKLHRINVCRIQSGKEPEQGPRILRRIIKYIRSAATATLSTSSTCPTCS